MGGPEVSIVIPFYNERECLPLVVEELRPVLDTLGPDCEVLLVDDGSDDGGPEILAEAARADARLHLLRLSRNRGKSAALDVGFRRASGKIVVTLDADLQNDPVDIPRLIEALRECDLAAGVRLRREDVLVRRLSSRVANAVRRLLMGEMSRDSACGMRAFRREMLERIPRFHGMHRFFPSLTRMGGGRVREIPIRHRRRVAGDAKYGLRDRAVRPLLDLLAVRWMKSRWIHPPLETHPRDGGEGPGESEPC